MTTLEDSSPPATPEMRDLTERRKLAEATRQSIAPYRSDTAGDSHSEKEYSVEELALAANTSVRNIRAYQDRDILPAPTLRGRKGIYNNRHLSRLRLIANLLERGYTLNSIREILQAMEQGIGLHELLGIEEAITSPWGNDSAATLKATDLVRRFGKNLTPKAIKAASDLNLIEMRGTDVRISSMNSLKVAQELCDTGIALTELLAIQKEIREQVTPIAERFVKLITEHVLSKYDDGMPPKEDMPQIADMVWRLRPLAEISVDAELGRAMDIATSQFLAGHVERIVANHDAQTND